jgi:hypothetical protein
MKSHKQLNKELTKLNTELLLSNQRLEHTNSILSQEVAVLQKAYTDNQKLLDLIYRKLGLIK